MKKVDPRVLSSSISKPVDPRVRPVRSSPSQGPLYVFPGFSVFSVSKVEDIAESNAEKHVSSLYISDARYNALNRCFCLPFVFRSLPAQSVRGPRPGSPESHYNSFFVSWELDSPPASEFKNDLSVLTAFYGTLTLNIPTLNFRAPLTMAGVEKHLTEKMLRVVLGISDSN